MNQWLMKFLANRIPRYRLETRSVVVYRDSGWKGWRDWIGAFDA